MNSPLQIYLVDHLTGSDGALDLLGRLIEEDPAGLGGFFGELRKEIKGEQDQLEALMDRFGYERSLVRSAGARIAEKVARVKLTGSDRQGGPLHLLEALDALQTAIQGKRGLWLALEAAAARDAMLAGPDYAGLAALASDQLDRLDRLRVQVAPDALTR